MSDFIAVTAIRHQDTDSQTQKKMRTYKKEGRKTENLYLLPLCK